MKFEQSELQQQLNVSKPLAEMLTELPVFEERARLIDCLIQAYYGQAETAITAAQEALSQFLHTNPLHNRLVLYLPFKLWPDLRVAANKPTSVYAEVFKLAWTQLLFELEPRANYVDGDVGNRGDYDIPMVSKAGHLLPFLLMRKIINFDELVKLCEVLKSEKVVYRSLMEGISAALQVCNLEKHESEFLANLLSGTVEDDSKIKIHYQETEKRRAWLERVELEIAAEAQSKEVAELLLEGKVRWNDFLEKLRAECEVSSSMLKAAFYYLDAAPLLDREKFVDLNQTFSLLNSTAADKDAYVSGINHLARKGKITDEVAGALGVYVPDLSQLTHFEAEYASLLEGIEEIEQDEFLKDRVLPMVLSFGSRVKGYARSGSDLDICLIYRPEVKLEERSEIRQRIRAIRTFENIDKILELWLASATEPAFRNSEDEFMINAQHVHILLESVWISNTKTAPQAQALRTQLLEKYTTLSRFGYSAGEIEFTLLRQIELSRLQYRLMHNGYARFYPLEPRAFPGRLSEIDWQSDFWDEGYRQIASVLYLRSVFLPQKM